MTAENATVNAYLRTKVLTAPPEQLRLMLIEGAIKFTRQGVEAMKAKDWEGVYNGYSQARSIVLELMNSVRPDVDPELCTRVSSLYLFLFQQLVDSGFEKDTAKGEKVIELLEYERETWVLLLDRLQQERSGGVTSHGAAAASPLQRPIAEPPQMGLPAIRRPAAAGNSPLRSSLSIQG
jgi:flagellar protein FliS